MIKAFLAKRDKARFDRDLQEFLADNKLFLQVMKAAMFMLEDDGKDADWIPTYNKYLGLYNSGKLFVAVRAKKHPLIIDYARRMTTEAEDLTTQLKDIRARLMKAQR
jgi:hypothetical protein